MITPVGMRARIAQDPYVRLARHRPFALFWTGQTISLFGDRLNQVALAVLVYATTNSALLTALTFFAATLPNVIIGPLGGVAADRFDRRNLMVATDLLRAVLVVTVPWMVSISPLLALVNVFLVTCASLVFRPAKGSVIPDLAPEGELQAASGATWLSDALADLVGFPVAGIIVGVLGPSLIVLVFVIDAATYVVSALCILPLPIKPIVRAPDALGRKVLALVRGDLIEGWRFLRRAPGLFENTMLSMVAQLTIGVNVALFVVYARTALDGGEANYPTYYAALNTFVGLGAIVGSLVAGRLGKLPKGPIILSGFAVMGIATIALGVSDNIVLAAAFVFISTVANLIWIVPTQTLFLQRTPAELMGRMVALRGSFVFGAITAAMFAAGLAAEVVPASDVIVVGGIVTVIAVAIGITRPALRDPDL